MKHRNTSKWARRALKRGINVMDEGTKDAIAEQLRVGQELRQKVRYLHTASHTLRPETLGIKYGVHQIRLGSLHASTHLISYK